jgi:serine protein kinase
MTKNNKSDKFLKLVGKHQERKKKDKFHGTLSEYLKIIEENTGVAKLAHKRLFDVISNHGITRMSKSSDRCNKLFNSREKKADKCFCC